jgi:anti-sigma factor RsiW
MVDCSEVRKTLWPADILRVSDDAVETALEHAAECPCCGAFLEADRRMAQLIRETVPQVRAPRELRERLYTVLARERAGSLSSPASGRGRRQALGIAAFLIVGLALGASGHWLAGRDDGAAPARAFAEDYLRRVVEQDELRTTDRLEIASFFARELGMSMPPPEIPEFQVQRATICLMNGRRGGVVEYRGRGKQLTYYVVPHASDGEGEQAAVAAVAGRPTQADPALAEERGLGVATWWDGHHQHALVGELPAQELRRLAPLFACPISRL